MSRLNVDEKNETRRDITVRYGYASQMSGSTIFVFSRLVFIICYTRARHGSQGEFLRPTVGRPTIENDSCRNAGGFDRHELVVNCVFVEAISEHANGCDDLADWLVGHGVGSFRQCSMLRVLQKVESFAYLDET